MEQVDIIGIDLAKRSFQLHGARSDGSVAFRRKVSREKLLHFLGAQQRCVVAMEASNAWSASRPMAAGPSIGDGGGRGAVVEPDRASAHPSSRATARSRVRSSGAMSPGSEA